MDYMEIVFALKAILASNDATEFAIVERHSHPADLAAALAKLTTADQCRLLGMASPAVRAQVFGYLSAKQQGALTAQFDRTRLAELLLHMHADERADLYNQLPEPQRDAALPALAQVEREDIRRLASYPEKTVGAVMTSDYATLPPDLTAREAIEELRRIAPDTETIYQSYVIDASRRLMGTVSLRELIVAAPHARVGDLMTPDPVSVPANAPREDAVRLIAKYDLLALPVINGGDMMVGIVTYDDAMDIEQAETDIDFRKVGAVSELGKGLKEASITLLYRKRVFWLVLLVFGNLFSGAGIAYFEDTILAYVALVFFLPLLVDSGGNAGSQSATLMVRALATGDVVIKDWAGMLGRELVVAGLLGATMALAVSGLGLWRGGPEIALVVALSMQLVVIVGSVIGMSLPFLLSRLKLDPATASAPLITSIADGTGVLIYFAIATAVLGLPGVD
ncbi:magnesium transporter [Thiocapsa imhoffii]|uniref:Magnesium transporter MgtE n=1 Tax=Thiocapsa imhoffii TaxID=382777 RepID=A0A9X1B749_9GAMM|nr:magnesium transporter [Thiocapsa imhoffii]MBK1643459.1 magnesium transporter [Thiocapsa imhoffii]